ncbi:hypothetical protein ACMV5L_01810 [Serratia plymuthica]|uniref:hypothetical protein n=1 Tax=Serratia plymuthica TaxID=82996 RepID=UPI003DA65D6F
MNNIKQYTRYKRAIIVASGPSAKNFSPPEGVAVIAVNGAIDWLPRADYFFTLDPSPENIRRLKNRRPEVIYCVAGFTVQNAFCFERVAYRNGPEPDNKDSPQWWAWRLQAVESLCTEVNKIHTGNSAWGALGLVYHLGIKQVALIGVDASEEPRVEGGQSNNLSHLPALFSSARHQINVVSLGKLSSIPQMTLDNWLAQK